MAYCETECVGVFQISGRKQMNRNAVENAKLSEDGMSVAIHLADLPNMHVLQQV
jgi:hypothetical protein